MLPPLEDEFLAVSLLSVGPFENTGMTAVEISPQRLESWMRLTGYELSPWQAETILEASKAYARYINDKKIPAPWTGAVDTVKASAAIKSAFRKK